MLVSLLILLQSFELSDSYAWLVRTPLWILPAVAINGLLALAGYTLARSIDRNGLATTLRRTAWRFLPALATVVVSVALLAGAIFSTRRLLLYYSDLQVWMYLLNIVGYFQNNLPDVFRYNKIEYFVNDQLFVIPILYIGVSLICLADIRQRVGNLILLTTIFFSIVLGILLQFGLLPYWISSSLAELATGRVLNGLIAMLGGALAYRARFRFMIDERVAALIGLFGAVFALIGNKSSLDNAVAGPALAIGATYLVLFAGCLRLPFRHAVLRTEPLLWRIFLWAYPVQQFWIAVGPGQQGAAMNLALSLPVIVILARALWHGVELPILRRVAPAVVEGHPLYAVQDRLSRNGRRMSPINAMQAVLPNVVAAVLIVLFTLGAIAIAVFALQRDQGGV